MRLAAVVFGVATAVAMGSACAQTLALDGGDLQKRANGVLALMGYMVTPDVTTGSLGISNGTTGNPDLRMTTLGGGFTLEGRPLYLEGTFGYARYDPTFRASDGTVERSVASDWSAYSATGGVGWDFPLARDLVLRPIFNLSFGRVDSAVSVSQSGSGREFDFLRNGRLDSYGVGGSLMLDYEHYRPEGEVDAELRYTDIRLQSLGGSSAAVQGSADAQSLSFWTRWRAPTGAVVLERPLRYALEFAHTRFLGDLDGVLGFNDVSSFGAGLELDSSARDAYVTRTRLMVRYKVGENVTGWSLGLAVNF
jgi:hypothetical protein